MSIVTISRLSASQRPPRVRAAPTSPTSLASARTLQPSTRPLSNASSAAAVLKPVSKHVPQPAPCVSASHPPAHHLHLPKLPRPQQRHQLSPPGPAQLLWRAQWHHHRQLKRPLLTQPPLLPSLKSLTVRFKPGQAPLHQPDLTLATALFLSLGLGSSLQALSSESWLGLVLLSSQCEGRTEDSHYNCIDSYIRYRSYIWQGGLFEGKKAADERNH